MPLVINAQELVVNGGFDHDVSFWQLNTQEGTAQWSPQDAAGHSTSGSLALQASFPCFRPDCSIPSAVQCALVRREAPFVLRADARGTGGQVYVVWYPSTDCTGQSLSSSSITLNPSSSWQHYETPAPTPPGVQSGLVVAWPFAWGAVPSAAFDNISLRSASAAAADVPALSRWHAATLAAALAACGALFLKFRGAA